MVDTGDTFSDTNMLLLPVEEDKFVICQFVFVIDVFCNDHMLFGNVIDSKLSVSVFVVGAAKTVI